MGLRTGKRRALLEMRVMVGHGASECHVVCVRGNTAVRVKNFLECGCMFWVHATGADDEDDVKRAKQDVRRMVDG